MKKLVIAIALLSACAGVLGLTRGTGPRDFPHRAHVLASVPCTRCHVGMAQDDGKTLHVPDDASCTTCHLKPHNPASCLGCHAGPDKLAELAQARAHLVFDHTKHLGTANGNCMRCHVGAADGDTHLRPPMAMCFKCHDHDAAQDARKCDACHHDLEGEKLLPRSHLAHDGDWLREHGAKAASSADLCQSCHAERFCATCHGVTSPLVPAAAHFSDPMTPSVHRAGFVSRHSLEARAEPGACATCHQPSKCVTCHVSRNVAGLKQRSPHPTGWVGIDNAHGREARRDPAACASCHDGAGQTLCVGCHKVGGVGGNPHPAGWSSRQPLVAMPCRLCHPIGSRP
ncbi:MAG: hypothetical protein NT062_26320 [Proteobacteria bacterium]|nr:hypothetical protein [Pseudomonadota bacterium]